MKLGAGKWLCIAFALSFAHLSNLAAQTMTQELAEQSAQELEKEATRLESMNDWAEALNRRQKVVEVLSSAFGEDSPRTDPGRISLANSLTTLGRYPEARAILEQCLATRQKTLGESDWRVADALNRIGETYRREGQVDLALEFYDKAARSVDSLQFQLRAMITNNRGLVLVMRGDLLAGEKAHADALRLLQQVPEDNPISVASILSNLGEVRRALGRTVEALSNQSLALEYLSTLPRQHPARALVENNLASVYRQQGRAIEARRIYQESLSSLLELRGPDDLDVLTVARNLALVFALEQDHATAISIIMEALGSLRRTGRTGHPLFLTLLNDQADRLADIGDISGCRQIRENVFNTYISASQTNHPTFWAARERLAIAARNQGDLATAREQLEPVLNYRKDRAKDSIRQLEELLSTLLEWARFQRAIGRVVIAQQILEQAMEQLTPTFGANHPLGAEILTEAGFMAEALDDHERALSLHRRAREIRMAALGEQSLAAAQSQINVAESLMRQGQMEAASREVEQALATITSIAFPDSPVAINAQFSLAGLLHRSGDLDKAASHYEAVLEVMKRQSLRTLPTVARDFAFLEWERGNRAEAARAAELAKTKHEAFWRDILRFASEDDRLAWRGTHDVFSALACVAQYNPLLLAEMVLRFKGVVLDSLIEDAQLVAPGFEGGQDVAQLRSARDERHRLELLAQGRQTPPGLQAVRDRVEELESRLAKRVSALETTRRSSTISLAQVQSLLNPDEVLVEFVRYQHSLGKGRMEPHFGALVIAPEKVVRWIDLGSADPKAPIAAAIADWQEKIHRELPAPATGSELIASLASLHDHIWSPIESAVGGAQTVVIAPDGDLAFVSFAALWNGGTFLGEHKNFRYVASGRDMEASAQPVPKNRSAYIFASPQLARTGWQRRVTNSVAAAWSALSNVLALRGGKISDLAITYKEIPDSLLEGKRVADLARRNGYQVVVPFVGENATEKAMREVRSPYLLHVATHGTFLPDQIQAGPSGNRGRSIVPFHPMHRSWIVLARANETLDAWRQGEVPDPMNDGLLTAMEAAQMPLAGTWLVTLSACDTGLGVGRSGEGVFGLRRAFALAGASHVLMTLWPVRDDGQFMEAYYADAFKSGDAVGALGRVQKQLLHQWRVKETPARAARFAGAFIINSIGRQSIKAGKAD